MIERQTSLQQPSKPFSVASFVPVLLVLAVALGGCSGYGPSDSPGAQLQFGVDMARQGLWNEALFRFRQADRLDPDNPRILNNLAVALEAAGRYEEALGVYQRAVRLAPSNAGLQRNYTRFSEFYQAYQPEDGAGIGEGFVPPDGGAAADTADPDPDAADPEGGRP